MSSRDRERLALTVIVSVWLSAGPIIYAAGGSVEWTFMPAVTLTGAALLIRLTNVVADWIDRGDPS